MYVCVWLSLRRKMYILSCYILPHLFYLPWHYVRVTGLYKSGCFLSNSGFFVCFLLGSTAHVTENSASRDHRPGHLQVQHWLCWKQLSLKTCQNGWLLDCIVTGDQVKKTNRKRHFLNILCIRQADVMLKKIWRANQRNPTIFMPCLYRSVFFSFFCFFFSQSSPISHVIYLVVRGLHIHYRIRPLPPFSWDGLSPSAASPLEGADVKPQSYYCYYPVHPLLQHIFFNTLFGVGVGFVIFFWGGYHNQLQILHISTCK